MPFGGGGVVICATPPRNATITTYFVNCSFVGDVLRGYSRGEPKLLGWRGSLREGKGVMGGGGNKTVGSVRRHKGIEERASERR